FSRSPQQQQQQQQQRQEQSAASVAADMHHAAAGELPEWLKLRLNPLGRAEFLRRLLYQCLEPAIARLSASSNSSVGLAQLPDDGDGNGGDGESAEEAKAAAAAAAENKDEEEEKKSSASPADASLGPTAGGQQGQEELQGVAAACRLIARIGRWETSSAPPP